MGPVTLLIVRLRRTPATDSESIAAVDPDPAVDATTDAAGDATARAETSVKGRPTPKRRDVAPRRQPVTAPRTSKEASQYRKQQVAQSKASGTTTKMTNAELRAARQRGDASALPRKDQGKVRQFTRDWVDTHRMASNYLLIIFPVYILGTFLYRLLTAVAAVILLAMIIECYLSARIIRKQAIARYGPTKESDLGLTFYILGRAYMPRRMRIPKPRFEIGETIPS